MYQSSVNSVNYLSMCLESKDPDKGGSQDRSCWSLFRMSVLSHNQVRCCPRPPPPLEQATCPVPDKQGPFYQRKPSGPFPLFRAHALATIRCALKLPQTLDQVSFCLNSINWALCGWQLWQHGGAASWDTPLLDRRPSP